MSLTKKRLEFQSMFATLMHIADQAHIDVLIYYYHRSPQEQNRLYKKGLSKCDGYKKKSKHQYWLAIDLVPFKDGKCQWRDYPELKFLGWAWEMLGGVWGGRWKDPYDPYHFQYGIKK